ncbi:hypothetical protein BURCENBC7_AP3902 [Burkholderia cenocepacia BC7]|nr:hypothetical protein BURCENK562V_C5530 [Burkholderia cenocepacia K56-2Valvano]ERI32183.1 hypothetical protein BURCENBC7_AP3902 [Burkholderia cenocepacia BC7]
MKRRDCSDPRPKRSLGELPYGVLLPRVPPKTRLVPPEGGHTGAV